MVVQDYLRLPTTQERIHSFQINFSAQTSAALVQDILEGRLTRKRHNLLGPPIGKKACLRICHRRGGVSLGVYTCAIAGAGGYLGGKVHGDGST